MQLDEFFNRVLRADLNYRLGGLQRLRELGTALLNRTVNRQSTRRAFEVGERHYDIGNDIFAAMLDPEMTYSCAYWASADDLEQAQRDKLDLICRKLELRPGDRLLDIGCGWGALAAHAARAYGARVYGVTISQEQLAAARERCAGLPVEIALLDYRDIQGHYDKVVSVGMFEHVGVRNYRTFFDTAGRLLRDSGLLLLHTIGCDRTSAITDAWIDHYIFPNGHLPSARELADALEGRFLIEDWHNFGPDYDRTLMAWLSNFEHAWPGLRARYGERFYRMWTYYLMSTAGFFRSRQGQLWQLVLSKRSRTLTYRSVR